MTPDQLSLLRQINQAVNAIPYVATPGPTEPVDYWTYEPEPGRSWVCRMSTQAKAEWLRHHGFDPTSLTVLLTYVETGEYHAVMAVETSPADWAAVLDSRFPDIYWIDQPPAGYRYDRRQVAGTTEFESVG